ncbi:hypothetical protein ACJ41O_003176 [Fusarium nematophilum]
MDDPISALNTIRQNIERFNANVDRIQPLPQNAARQARLEHLEGLINNQLLFTRADTQGNVDARPIKQLVLEQAMLESEAERDRQEYARRVQEAISELGDALSPIFSQRTRLPATALPTGHALIQVGSAIPTPTRTSPSNQDNHHGSDRSESRGRGEGLGLGDDDDDTTENRGSGADLHDTSNTHHQPRATNDQASSPNTRHLRRPGLRKRTSTVAITTRQAKRPRRAARPTTRALPAPRTIRRRTKGQKEKPYQWVAPRSYHDLNPKVANPKPGDIFSCWWPGRTRKGFVPAMVIPWGEFQRFGYTETLEETELNMCIPKCYAGAREDDVTQRPWAEGYEDGGPLAHKRKFPVLFFSRMKFPIGCRGAWVPLHNLKEYDENCPHTVGQEIVAEYLRFKARCERESAEVAARMARRRASRPPGHSATGHVREGIEDDHSRETSPVVYDSEEDESFDSDLPGELVQSHSMDEVAWESGSEADDSFSC